MLRYMLDTNTCVFVLKQTPTWLGGKFQRHMGQICISVVTLGELCWGAEKSQRRLESLKGVDDFVSGIAVLDLDRQAVIEYGRIRAALRHQPIGALDMLIAGHALSRDLTIVTNNTSEFERVPGLDIEDWSVRPARR